jgi:hypothetical protein
LVSRIVVGPTVESRDDLYELDTYNHDFDKIEAIQVGITHLDTRAILQRLFTEVTAGIDQNSHNEKWLRFSDYVSRRIRHPPFTQPMYADKTMVMHPLVLLILGEGRCGHVARVVVDVALANGYEARLVQLAAHLVAEVKWNGRWHFVDANADFPIESLQADFDELPSVYELSKTPYILDRLPTRGWMWSEKDLRSTTGAKKPYITFYPGRLLTSSVYFAEEILHNKYSGNPNKPRQGIQYWSRKGTHYDWQDDRHYGWRHVTLNEEQPIDPVPIEFHPMPLSISVPTIEYVTEDEVEIPVRFFPLKRITISDDQSSRISFDPSEIQYKVRVSSQSRGWDYDYRNYQFMPALGKADLAVYNTMTKYEGGMIGVNVKLKMDFERHFRGETEVFIDVVPQIETLHQRGYFSWPSREAAVQIYDPDRYQIWNQGEKLQKNSRDNK